MCYLLSSDVCVCVCSDMCSACEMCVRCARVRTTAIPWIVVNGFCEWSSRRQSGSYGGCTDPSRLWEEEGDPLSQYNELTTSIYTHHSVYCLYIRSSQEEMHFWHWYWLHSSRCSKQIRKILVFLRINFINT